MIDRYSHGLLRFRLSLTALMKANMASRLKNRNGVSLIVIVELLSRCEFSAVIKVAANANDEDEVSFLIRKYNNNKDPYIINPFIKSSVS